MKLEKLFEFMPKSNIQAGEGKKEGLYPFFTSSDTKKLFIDRCLFDCEAIIIGTGGVPSCNYCNGKFSTSTDNFVLKAVSTVLPKFLYYFLRSNNFEVLAKGFHGAGLKHISKEYIKNIDVPILTIEKQKEIIHILDILNDTIENTLTRLELYDELIKARFVELFGDGRDGKTPVKMLGHICRFQQGTQIPVEEQFEEQKTGYKRFLRIIDYTQAPQPPRYVNVNGKEVDEKSVVIVRYGATAGFVGRGYQGILANNLFEIMPDETILSKEILFLALKYGTFEKEVHDKAFGAAMPALSFSMMNDIPVVVPMAEEQKKFVSFVEQTDKSKFEATKTLEYLEELKAALMAKYFG